MKDDMPRILFAAPRSGSGKTMIACGMIELCKRRGLKTAACKCGPDYIDTMFHRKVLGVPAGNLDTFFTDEETTRFLLKERAKEADITILEGVMGYYDGLGGTSDRASTYEVARTIETPVILVVDGKGASVSLAALIKGILDYRKDSGIEGVILNRVSAGCYERLKELIEKECRVPVAGYMPELPELEVPSRHLGLIPPEEMETFKEWSRKVADTMEKTIEVDKLLFTARKAKAIEGREPEIPKLSGKVRLAVARDEAFSFYYAENLELLMKMGAEICYFSPIHDEKLPEEIDGLLLGGGYPENYGMELEEAGQMQREIKKACERGLPTLAECGGFLYLQKELLPAEGRQRKMAGVLPGKAFYMGKLCRFGYIEAKALTAGVLGDAGSVMKGHEFHYFDCTENGEDFQAKKPTGKTEYLCMVHTPSMAAGFPHFYYYSNPEMIYQFLKACESFRAGRLSQRHWDRIAKPIDSLGMLEDYVVKLSRISGKETPYDCEKKALLVLCGDHGVVKEGVTQTGSEVTRIVGENFAKGCSTVNYMAKVSGVDVFTVDMGMDTPHYKEKQLVQGAVIDRKIERGCGNIAIEPAMTMEQCQKALDTGIALVGELKKKGYRIVATGEMGIGNTTPTSVLAALFLDQEAEVVTGKGAGLSKEGFHLKCQVVKQAAERVRAEGIRDPKAVLAQAGGYEIAGMTGVFLGGIIYRMPIVIDGAISAVAALAAQRIDRRASEFMIASHVSDEPVGKLALKELKLEAAVHARMCLGEGTGAMAVMPLLDMGLEVYRKMGTFGEYQIGEYVRYEEVF